MKNKYVKTSLIVVGGGPAGVCAALSAARLGVDTVLVHNRPVLGGNSSSEIRVWTRGATGAGNLFGEEMGILGILKMRNLYTNPKFNPVFWDEVLLDAVLGQKNLTLLLNTNVDQVECCDEGIQRIHGVQQASEIVYTLEGRMYIDATGDGLLGAQTLIPYQVGNTEYSGKEKEKSRELLSSSILYFVKDTGKPVPFIAPDYAYDIEYIESLVNQGGRIISEKQTASDCWWFEYGGLRNTITDSQEITIELKKLVLGIWNYIKNSGKYPNAETCTLEWIGNIPGKRESRRMITEYMLRGEDILENRHFEDGAFYGGWYMDFHPAGGLNSKEKNCTQIPVNIYTIPLRCLYNKKVKNLLFAGRCIGTEQEAFSTSRIMNTCALSGQAAATLAWKCLEANKEPSNLGKQELEEILQTLLREDMFIPGKKCECKEDLAPAARVTASSQHQVEENASEEKLPLKGDVFLMVPASDGAPLMVRLQNLSKEVPVRLSVAYYCEDLPSRLRPGKKVKEEILDLEPGEQWIELRLPEEAKRQFCMIFLKDHALVELRLNKTDNPGILCGKKDSPGYRYPCVRWNVKDIYSPAQVTNGYTRPYRHINLWCSAKEKNPWILLEWEKMISFRELRLYLEPDLSEEIPSSCGQRWDESHKFALRSTMPPQLIRALSVDIFENGEWKTLTEVSNNWQRMIVLGFDQEVSAQKLRITVNQTWGDTRAHLYQISVYKNRINVSEGGTK